MPGGLTLILGGARSGKSSQAERLADQVGGEVLYVATAHPIDEEMEARIEAHRTARPEGWRTLEARTKVGRSISRLDDNPDVLLLDCITLLANNVFPPEAADDAELRPVGEAALEREIDELLDAWQSSEAHWIVVSNEVGMGLVPPYPLGRAYRDALGRANQRLAAAADRVILMVAGLPLWVKGGEAEA